MNNNSDSPTFPNTICSKCRFFYPSSPQSAFDCPHCYKTLNPDPKPLKTMKAKLLEEWIENPLPSFAEPGLQIDRKLCWDCGRKTSMAGYDCRCGYSFCRKHRIPETHSCGFNYVKEGKDFLTRDNPLVKRDKVERI